MTEMRLKGTITTFCSGVGKKKFDPGKELEKNRRMMKETEVFNNGILHSVNE
jgi:hypothetical protein